MHNNICRLYKFSLYLTEFHVKNARCIIRRRSFQIYAHESGFHIRIQTHWRCVVALLFIYKGGKRRSRLTKKKIKPITYKRNIDETTSFKRMLQHLLEYIPRQRFTALYVFRIIHSSIVKLLLYLRDFEYIWNEISETSRITTEST